MRDVWRLFAKSALRLAARSAGEAAGYLGDAVWFVGKWLTTKPGEPEWADGSLVDDDDMPPINVWSAPGREPRA